MKIVLDANFVVAAFRSGMWAWPFPAHRGPAMITWWALDMTFGSLPGICLVGFCFECGYEDRKVSPAGFVAMLRRVYRARNDAIKDTGRLLGGKHAALLAFLIGLLLLCVVTDTLMLVAVNASAIPVSAVSYRFGRKHRLASGLSVNEIRRLSASAKLHDHSSLWRHVALLALIWLSLVAALLALAYALGFWHPQ